MIKHATISEIYFHKAAGESQQRKPITKSGASHKHTHAHTHTLSLSHNATPAIN